MKNSGKQFLHGLNGFSADFYLKKEIGGTDQEREEL
jgi:hypothetical protein